MATLVEQAPPLPSRPATPPPHITLNTSVRGTPAAIPNKHIPVCSPGKAPTPTGLTSPQQSPASVFSFPKAATVLSLTQQYLKLSDSPPIYSIDPSTVYDALEEQATQPLPDPRRVFPWLHGLHADNSMQLAFFVHRRKSLRRVPQVLRGVTVIKCGGDLNKARLKGTVTPDEILTFESLAGHSDGRFIEADPREGFSVRNFQIQPAKMATVSDIIVYGDDDSKPEDVLALARKCSFAQFAWKSKLHNIGWESGTFNTFVVLSSFKIFEETCPDIVAIGSDGIMTGRVVDFCKHHIGFWYAFLTIIVLSERIEMSCMTKASEIAPNVYLGPTPDPIINPPSPEDPQFDVLIEASDLAQMPDAKTLKSLKSVLRDPQRPTVQFEVPGSGSIMPPTWSHTEIDGLLNICQWIYDISNDETTAGASPEDGSEGSDSSECQSDELAFDVEGDIVMKHTSGTKLPRTPRKVLIHCADGYTESTLLAITYFMFAHGLTVADAWIRMHRELHRNFFAYPTDVQLLTSIQPRILTESPTNKSKSPSLLTSMPADPEWLCKLDGSLPSRVLDYMYLGNLNHANNPQLLRELGIGRIVSVGEKVNWTDRPVSDVKTVEGGAFDGFEFVVVENVQDNGVDNLSHEFERCLEFIGMFQIHVSATS